MTTKEIAKIISQHFPIHNGEKWDHNGWQYRCFHNVVKKVVVALDVTSEVVEYAIAQQSSLIITHHPFIFNKMSQEKKLIYKQKLLTTLHKHQINVYSIHTIFDAYMNESVLKVLGDYQLISPPNKNIFSIGHYDTLSVTNILTNLKKLFNIPVIQHNNTLPSHINNLAICMGAGGSLITKLPAEVDLYITGEVKWNEWIIAQEKKLPVVCFNHQMEDYFINLFTRFLINQTNNQIVVLPFQAKSLIQYD